MEKLNGCQEMDEASSEETDMVDIFATLKDAARGKWDVDADELLLKGLMTMQARFSARLGSVRKEVEGLSEDTRFASIQLGNTTNSFILLSQRQFVQNRVSIDDVEGRAALDDTESGEEGASFSGEKSYEDIEAKVTHVCQDAINLAARILDERIMPFSTDDAVPVMEPDSGNNVLGEGEAFQISANYHRRARFMALIGSEQFANDPYSGYFNEICRVSRQSLTPDRLCDGVDESLGVHTQPKTVLNEHTTGSTCVKRAPPPPPPPPPPSGPTNPPNNPQKMPPPPPPPSGPANPPNNLQKMPPPPPPPPKRTYGAKGTAAPAATKAGLSTFLGSSDSSDDPAIGLPVTSQPRVGGKRVGAFLKKTSSGSSSWDDSSESSGYKLPAKPAPQKRAAVTFASDSGSESDGSAAHRAAAPPAPPPPPPPPAAAAPAKEVPKALPRVITSHFDSSSSEETLRAALPPKTLGSKIQSGIAPNTMVAEPPPLSPAVAPKRTSRKGFPVFSSSDDTWSEDAAPAPKARIPQAGLNRIGAALTDVSEEKKHMDPTALTGRSNMFSASTTSLPTPMEGLKDQNTASAHTRSSFPILRRDDKAVSTSSGSDWEKDEVWPHGRPSAVISPGDMVKTISPSFPPPTTTTSAKPAGKVVPQLSSRNVEADCSVLHAPRKIVPNLTFGKRRISSSSDSDA